MALRNLASIRTSYSRLSHCLSQYYYKAQLPVKRKFHINKSQLGSSQLLHNRTTATDTSPETIIQDPLEQPDFFNVSQLVIMKELFDARVHLGHNAGVRNPLMTPYIFGTRLRTDIIDLDQTAELLKDALNFTAHVAFREGVILFISRHQQMMPLIERIAEDCGEYSHCREWKGGTFTNANVQFNAVTRLPDLVIFLSTHDTVFRPHVAITESAKLNIPTIGILDTSCDPTLITYPVPGNDDTPSAIELYCKLFKKVIINAKAKRKEMLEKGLI